MVTYSRWDPSTGAYDYFDAEGRPGLNDDLPVPLMPAGTEIGVPSVECGRPMPPGAVHIGSGEFAVGFIAPPASVDLLSSSGSIGSRLVPLWLVLAGAVLGALAGYSFGRRR